MKLGIENVEPLEKFSAQDFSKWLQRGFADLHHEERRLTAFSPMEYYVRIRGDITGELNDIYDVLSGSAQEQFCSGIAIALSELPPKHQAIPIARSLLHLAGAVHAREVVPEAIKQIGNGLFGLEKHTEGRELFALMLDIISGMSPAYGLGDEIRSLIYSPLFREDYAPMAFIALCRTEPAQFPKHLKLLNPCFTALHRKDGTGDAFFTAHRFLRYVDLTLIGCNLWKLFLSKQPNVDDLITDNWLAKALFCGENAPLYLIKIGDNYLISRRDMEQSLPPVKIFIETGTDTDTNTWDHVYDVEKFLDSIVTIRLEPDIEEAKELKTAIEEAKELESDIEEAKVEVGVSGAYSSSFSFFMEYVKKNISAVPNLHRQEMDAPNNNTKEKSR